ncbi:MAG: hypothetical protein WBM00_04815 [Solirubrobacterales bacterium]
MNLTKQERAAILAGQHPKITRKVEVGADPPFKAGETTSLRELPSRFGPVPQVWIHVIARRRGAGGRHWVCEYSVRDDRPLYLAKGTDYTRTPAQAIDTEATVLDEEAARKSSAETRLRVAQSTQERSRQAQQVRNRVRVLLAELPAERRLEFLVGLQRLVAEFASRDKVAA